MAEGLTFEKRPDGYSPPDWKRVSMIAAVLRQQRQAVFNHVWEIKKARRGQWDDVIKKIPRAYRKMQPDVDIPEIRDMLNRVVGMVAGQEIQIDVDPPSSRREDVSKAAKERARLAATVSEIEDQQDRPTFAMGIDAQLAWGESWIGVWPDPRPYGDLSQFTRGKDEDAGDYSKRFADASVQCGIPIVFQDYDPQTVLPFWGDNNRLLCVIIESEHTALDIDMGMGYRPIKGAEGKTLTWEKKTLSEPYVSADITGGTQTVDITHAVAPTDDGERPPAGTVKKTIYCDPWALLVFLDGVLVQRWEHNFGVVPIFPAGGSQTSDRDPGWGTASIIDAPLAIAKQLVFFSAILASNAMQHGWPTPFLKNPETGLVGPNGQPLTRQIVFGEMNPLGSNEEIIFPFLDAKMMPDFFKHLDFLTTQLSNSSLSNFSQAIGSEMAGYAVAQVRALQSSALKPAYLSAARQWRKICYFIRWLIEHCYPAGIHLRGAVETAEVDGKEVFYRPVLEYGKKHTTDFAINVVLQEGIVQDQLAKDKSAIEKVQAGLWSPRRGMEETGVEDPAAESDEIAEARLLNSQAADQQVLVMAMAIAAERYQVSRTDMSSPFMQALAQAQRQLMGGGDQQQVGAGTFQNQGGAPQNALPGGQPMQQNPSPAAPQQGGPAAGPGVGTGTNLEALGAPGIPGGVKGGNEPVAV